MFGELGTTAANSPTQVGVTSEMLGDGVLVESDALVDTDRCAQMFGNLCDAFSVRAWLVGMWCWTSVSESVDEVGVPLGDLGATTTMCLDNGVFLIPPIPDGLVAPPEGWCLLANLAEDAAR